MRLPWVVSPLWWQRGRRFSFLCKFPCVCLKKSFFFSPTKLVISDELTATMSALFFCQKIYTNKFYIEALRDKREIWRKIFFRQYWLTRFAIVLVCISFFFEKTVKLFLQTKHTIIKCLFILMPAQRIMTTTTCTTCVICVRKIDSYIQEMRAKDTA